MPEGPEIRRAALKLSAVLEGQTVEKVQFGLPRLRRFAKTLTDARVVNVTSRSKAMLTAFDNGLTIYSHNQLYGVWYVVARDKPPNTKRSLRVGLHTSRHSALLYSASDIEVLTEEQLALHPYLAKLGVDALDESLPWQAVRDRLIASDCRRRTLAALYLDQGCIAGMGNYLRSEILHEARVHPMAKPAELTATQLRKLAQATLAITRRSLQTGGITNAERRVKTLKKQGYKREALRFAAFAREGLPCYHCQQPIKRISVSSRRLYFCPSCQRNVEAKT